MLQILSLLVLATVHTNAQSGQYGQCFAPPFDSSTIPTNMSQNNVEARVSQEALPASRAVLARPRTNTILSVCPAEVELAVVPHYTVRPMPSASLLVANEGTAQCGGQGYSGPSNCVSGASCSVVNEYFSICNPSGAGAIPGVGGDVSVNIPSIPNIPDVSGVVGDVLSSPKPSQASKVENKSGLGSGGSNGADSSDGAGDEAGGSGGGIQKPKSFLAKEKPGKTETPGGGATKVAKIGGGGGGVAYAGVNIAGCDFGCSTDVSEILILPMTASKLSEGILHQWRQLSGRWRGSNEALRPKWLQHVSLACWLAVSCQ